MNVPLQASLLLGGPGTAKTSIVNQFLQRFLVEETTSKTITFSSLTTPAIFQTAVEVPITASLSRVCKEKHLFHLVGPRALLHCQYAKNQ